MTHTYRATVAVPLEITTKAPLTEAEVREVGDRVVRIRLSLVEEALGVVRAGARSSVTVSIDDAWCTAVNRRNKVDGRLYACQMSAAHPIHGSVEDCSASGLPCDRPGEHHEFVSPGFEDPADGRAEILAGIATFDAPAGAGYAVETERG